MRMEGGKRKGDPGYGQGRVRIAVDDDVLLDEGAVTRRLQEVFSAPDYRPPTLPSVATELMAISQKPEVGIDEVVALLERDTLLTGRVLRIAQSPVYAGAGKLASVRDAVMRLGLQSLRDLVLEACMNMRVFKAEAYSDTMERLRLHSSLTGHLAKLVCRYTAIEQEFAFLCGLLHDVGVAGSLIALCEGVARNRLPDLVAIWPAIDRGHAEAGALMARLWDLPPEVQLAMAHHHQVRVERHPHPLAATVCIANELAHELGVGLLASEDDGEAADAAAIAAACLQSHTTVDRSGDKTLAIARDALEIDDARMALIRDEARALLERLH